MGKLRLNDLCDLQEYALVRDDFRAKVMQHKQLRALKIDQDLVLHFEDALTIQYQLQEALLVENLDTDAAKQRKLEIYNAFIPDGNNLKASLIASPRLARMKDIEHAIWLQIGDHSRLFAEVSEILLGDITSVNRYICFELSPEMINDLKCGSRILAGVDHPDYSRQVDIEKSLHDALANDLISFAGDFHGIG